MCQRRSIKIKVLPNLKKLTLQDSPSAQDVLETAKERKIYIYGRSAATVFADSHLLMPRKCTGRPTVFSESADFHCSDRAAPSLKKIWYGNQATRIFSAFTLSIGVGNVNNMTRRKAVGVGAPHEQILCVDTLICHLPEPSIQSHGPGDCRLADVRTPDIITRRQKP